MTGIFTADILAAGTERVDIQGVTFDIPEDLQELVTVETEGLQPDEIVSVSETASIEASKALGENYEGAGWLFSIVRMPEQKVRELRCGAMDGMEVFAEDDDFCLIYAHPTDVRFVREQYDDIEEDQAQWSALNEWAFGDVRREILANNRELDEEIYSNTELDMYLAKAAFGGARYEVRSLEFGDSMPAYSADDEDYLEELADDMFYEQLYDEEAPDGEYLVLDLVDEGVRIDFFLGEQNRNLVREVRQAGDVTIENLYKAVHKDTDGDDEIKTSTGIMEEWCRELMYGEDDD